jgi:opacity protein-like surface antigen
MKMRLLTSMLLLAAAVIAAIGGAAAQDAEPFAERELMTVLGYGDHVFEPEMWLARGQEFTDRTTAQWDSQLLGGLAYADYMHFDDEIRAEQMPGRFDTEWFDVTLRNYDAWTQTASCVFDNLRLHEFTVRVGEQKYLMRYWVELVTSERVLTLFMVFPATSPDVLDVYSERFRPGASKCGARP